MEAAPRPGKSPPILDRYPIQDREKSFLQAYFRRNRPAKMGRFYDRHARERGTFWRAGDGGGRSSLEKENELCAGDKWLDMAISMK
jgi:hypothetical protein